MLAFQRHANWFSGLPAAAIVLLAVASCLFGCRHTREEGRKVYPPPKALGSFPMEECPTPFVSLFGTQPADLVLISPEPVEGLAEGVSLVSDFPLFGRLSFDAGAVEAGLILDEPRGTGTGYSMALVDTNGDGRLADETPCDLSRAPKIAERRGAPSSEPFVDLVAPGGESRRVYFAFEDAVSSAPGAATTLLPEQRVALVARSPQARWASVPIGDRSVSLVAVDNDGDGCFGPWVTDTFLLDGCKGQRAPDVLCVDHDGNGQLDVDLTTLFPGELLVGSLLSTHGRMLELRVDRSGNEVCVMQSGGALAPLQPGADVRINAVMSSVTDASHFMVAQAEAGEPVVVPADSYALPLCRMAATDAQGRVWILVGGDVQLYAVGGVRGPFEVTDDMTALPFGPPLSMVVDVAVFGRDVYLTPSLTGVGGRHWALLVGNDSPSTPPTFRVRDASGQTIGEGSFPVRHGLPERFVWHGPADAPAGAYTVEVTWRVGPFPWEDAGRTKFVFQ